MKQPDNRYTFRFFDYKWKQVPDWGRETEAIYRRWYLKRYGYATLPRDALSRSDLAPPQQAQSS